MSDLTTAIILECKKKLLEAKSTLLMRVKSHRDEFSQQEFKGDDGDQSMFALAEHEFLTNQERLRAQILEIETALARMERGLYGVCEETEEPIEVDRLLAIPWTRLSIEGAEIREALDKRYAR